jgi:putative lipoic acid-binding regulatory protein
MSDIFNSLRAQLEFEEWPNVFLFKLIGPNNSETVARITALFDEGTDLHYQPSKTGKYISISVKEMMMDVDSIIAKYEQAALIEGVMTL